MAADKILQSVAESATSISDAHDRILTSRTSRKEQKHAIVCELRPRKTCAQWTPRCIATGLGRVRWAQVRAHPLEKYRSRTPRIAFPAAQNVCTKNAMPHRSWTGASTSGSPVCSGKARVDGVEFQEHNVSGAPRTVLTAARNVRPKYA